MLYDTQLIRIDTGLIFSIITYITNPHTQFPHCPSAPWNDSDVHCGAKHHSRQSLARTSLSVCVNHRRSDRPKQEIKHTQHPLNFKIQHNVWISISKDSHKVLIPVVHNRTCYYLLHYYYYYLTIIWLNIKAHSILRKYRAFQYPKEQIHDGAKKTNKCGVMLM